MLAAFFVLPENRNGGSDHRRRYQTLKQTISPVKPAQPLALSTLNFRLSLLAASQI